MRVLMLRGWNVLPYAATFSTLSEKGVGGTELQLLHHARALSRMGHVVTVFGVTPLDKVEENVSFIGVSGRDHVLKLLADKYQHTDVIFVNVKTELSRLKSVLPRALVVEVCQNGPHFACDAYIDLYAFVGLGQFAYYSTKFKQYRHKFVSLPSVPPWNEVYSKFTQQGKSDQIIWVGSVQKQGFRRWAKAMQIILERHTLIKWVLCVPSYDVISGDAMPSACSGIKLPASRIEFINLPIRELAAEIARSKILLASLGGEDGPVSYLDGHASGVPVLCGDDIYGKFYNPEGLGLRCTTVSDCVSAIEFLIAHPDVGKQMGAMGRKWIAGNFTEDHQYSCIEQIMSYVQLRQHHVFPAKKSFQSDKKFSLAYWRERLEIKISKYFRSGQAG